MMRGLTDIRSCNKFKQVQAPLKKTHTLKQRITSGFVRGQPAQFQNVNFLVHTPIHKWQTRGKKTCD